MNSEKEPCWIAQAEFLQLEYTAEQVAKLLGITPAKVKQLEKRGLLQLTNERINGEAKPTSNELDKFLSHLEQCCAADQHNCDGEKPARRNAHKKWLGSKRCRAPMFWAIRSGGDSRVFNVEYAESNLILLKRTAEESLRFSSSKKLDENSSARDNLRPLTGV